MEQDCLVVGLLYPDILERASTVYIFCCGYCAYTPILLNIYGLQTFFFLGRS